METKEWENKKETLLKLAADKNGLTLQQFANRLKKEVKKSATQQIIDVSVESALPPATTAVKTTAMRRKSSGGADKIGAFVDKVFSLPKDKVLDVSGLTEKGTGSTTVNIPKTKGRTKIMVPGLPILSNNLETYKIAIGFITSLKGDSYEKYIDYYEKIKLDPKFIVPPTEEKEEEREKEEAEKEEVEKEEVEKEEEKEEEEKEEKEEKEEEERSEISETTSETSEVSEEEETKEKKHKHHKHKNETEEERQERKRLKKEQRANETKEERKLRRKAKKEKKAKKEAKKAKKEAKKKEKEESAEEVEEESEKEMENMEKVEKEKKELYDKMSLKALKEEAKKQGKAMSGTRAVIIERLLHGQPMKRRTLPTEEEEETEDLNEKMRQLEESGVKIKVPKRPKINRDKL